MTHTTHAAFLLAAGGSTRLGTPKQLLKKNGTTLVRHIAELLLQTHPSELIVVTGGAADAVTTALSGLKLRTVFNPHWSTGLASSVQCAIRTRHAYADCALICATDQPHVTHEHLQALLTGRPQNADIITGYGAENSAGIPACLDARTLARASELTGDSGFRHLWQQGARPKRLENPALAMDIDTPAQHAAAVKSGAIDP